MKASIRYWMKRSAKNKLVCNHARTLLTRHPVILLESGILQTAQTLFALTEPLELARADEADGDNGLICLFTGSLLSRYIYAKEGETDLIIRICPRKIPLWYTTTASKKTSCLLCTIPFARTTGTIKNYIRRHRRYEEFPVCAGHRGYRGTTGTAGRARTTLHG